jgi:hypothetical protein
MEVANTLAYYTIKYHLKSFIAQVPVVIHAEKPKIVARNFENIIFEEKKKTALFQFYGATTLIGYEPKHCSLKKKKERDEIKGTKRYKRFEIRRFTTC